MIFLHILAILLAVAALTLLVVFAALDSSAALIVGMSLFGSALVFFYGARAAHFCAEWKKHHYAKLAADLNHVALYILVACTYTPVALALPERAWGWSIFGVAWGISVVAAALRLPLYWVYGAYFVLDLTAFSVVHAFLNSGSKWFFGIGGMAYILATILEAKKKKGALSLTLIGSIAHFWAMLWLIYA